MFKRTGLALALAMWTGCLGGTDAGHDVATGETAAPVLTANALTPAALAHGALTTDQLDAAAAARMAASADAREVLAYAVDCALASTQAVSFESGGTTYQLGGALGLAPAWTDRALTASEAAWVSACVFSRVNLTGVSVALSARGAHAALGTSSNERADYQLEEGAFWGNAFLDRGPLAAYACDGVDQAADDTIGDLPARQCAQPSAPGSDASPCGMHYVGLCDEVCTTTGPYAGCAAPGEAAASEVITSVLAGAR